MAQKNNSNKKDKGLELVYGVHPIIELLKAKRRTLVTIYTTKPVPKAWSLIEPLLTSNTQLQYVSRDVLTRLVMTTDHQSVVGLATPFVKRSKFFDPQKSPFLILLDSIHDPQILAQYSGQPTVLELPVSSCVEIIALPCKQPLSNLQLALLSILRFMKLQRHLVPSKNLSGLTMHSTLQRFQGKMPPPLSIRSHSV